jgi:adenosyl cobinamide kinase/adenosyl cobinamide phosphate guanylyltransferase
MATATTPSAGIDPQVLADLDAVMQRLATGKPVDSETSRRIRERAERITEEIREQHGELDVAVELIRETRDEV